MQICQIVKLAKYGRRLEGVADGTSSQQKPLKTFLGDQSLNGPNGGPTHHLYGLLVRKRLSKEKETERERKREE